jgi:hypothetical protein
LIIPPKKDTVRPYPLCAIQGQRCQARAATIDNGLRALLSTAIEKLGFYKKEN